VSAEIGRAPKVTYYVKKKEKEATLHIPPGLYNSANCQLHRLFNQPIRGGTQKCGTPHTQKC
jgi:hypothetical protein